MPSQRPGGLYVVSSDAGLRQHVATVAASAGRAYDVLADLDGVAAALASQPCAFVIDHDETLGRAAFPLVTRGRRAGGICIVVTRGPLDAIPRGADVVTDTAAVDEAVRVAARPISVRRDTDALLGVSVLGGAVDVAVQRMIAQLAAGFGASRAVLAVGESQEPAHAHCRASLACEATITVPAGDGCASYLGVAFDDRSDGLGCIGLVADGPRIFTIAERRELETLSARLGHELAWRGTHDRAAAELDRLAHTAGVDPLTRAWNRDALVRLTAMYLSTSMRFKQTLGVIIIDIVDLHGLNRRRGLDAGDLVLSQIAAAARAYTRVEDLVGRWGASTVAVVLQGTSLDGTHRAAARIQERVGTDVPLRLGVCVAYPNEDAATLLDRALRLAKQAAPGSTVRPDTGDEVGTTLGGTYRLLHEIGQGAMGVVYRGEDLALERPVAIKMLRPDLVEDPDVVEQLRAEASLLARLEHPNLVHVYSFAQGGGDAYIVMELVEGECLLQAIDRHVSEGTQFALSEVLAIAVEVGSALDALHDHGVVHRDVKPANVIRDPFRARSVLVDVGIARRFGQSVETAGTPGYVAPEVIRGGDATQLSDVYGFASTIYSLLTLVSPWPDEDRVAMLTRQAAGEPITPLSARVPELAAADSIMRAALSPTPADRPPSAGAFARALVAALGDVSTAAPRFDLSTPALKLPPATTMRGLDAPRTIEPRQRSSSMRDDVAARPSTGRLILPRRAQAAQMRTRGVVFRSVARVLGVREAERLRDRLAVDEPELARALADAAPLDWVPTQLFTRLLALAPSFAERDGAALAREIGRATVQASFRRFFPASPATLMPERTLSVIRTIWSRYQTWGTVAHMPRHAGDVVVRITETPRNAELCGFASGLCEQMVLLSGGLAPHVEHEGCEARGDAACLFHVTWESAV